MGLGLALVGQEIPEQETSVESHPWRRTSRMGHPAKISFRPPAAWSAKSCKQVQTSALRRFLPAPPQ